MAFTTPGTAVAGEVLTAAFWNEQVRDNTNALYSRFRILQVVSDYTAAGSGTTISTSSFTATGLDAVITPSSTSSKILVIVNQANRKSNANSATECQSRLYRNGSAVDANLTLSTCYTGTALELRVMASLTYLDSPATTSAVTYAMYAAATIGTISTDYFASGSITLMEVAA